MSRSCGEGGGSGTDALPPRACHPDPSAAILDSQSVKTVEESARIHGYDAHKCVKGRKRHLLADTLGLSIAHYITPAAVHDTVGARKRL